MNVLGYTIDCTKGECNSAYFRGDVNEANITLIRDVTSLQIRVTANNTCGPPLSTFRNILVARASVIFNEAQGMIN